MSTKQPQILAIGGSDPGGGAGIQADAKTIHACGGYALTVVASITAQNTREVRETADVAPHVIRAQLAAVFGDFSVAAIKTGMLGSPAAVTAVARELAQVRSIPVVVDPVMVASSGDPLLAEDGVDLLRRRLLPLARLCTPNRFEAEILSGLTLRSLRDAEAAARRIQDLGPRAVLIKGGHLEGPRANDLLLDGDEVRLLDAERIAGPSPHGTGCTLAAAIATWLGRGADLTAAVEQAKRYVTVAIRQQLKIGRGRPVLNHQVDPGVDDGKS